MVTKKKAPKQEPTPLGLFLTTDVKHQVGSTRYSFMKDQELMSDTPANIVSYLEKLGIVKPKDDTGSTGEGDSNAE